ncbi:MAG: bifunctional folylpolyglutamate synthase/dihydrofolate synthase [Armatimonadota bacterium]
MTFEQAAEFLFGLIDYEKTPAQIQVSRYLNLERMRDALARAGNPERGLRCAHIAGTKGKGSTAAMLEQIARAAGLRTGLFTSPHLTSFTERIRVNGEPIAEEAFAALVETVVPVIEAMHWTPHGSPTFFEASTLCALLYFHQQQVELAVLETGMGGRLDATNVVTPLATAITTIALDHTIELGESLDLIAGEKAGIIKPAVPVISAPQEPLAAGAITRVAREVGAPLYRVGDEITVQPSDRQEEDGQTFTVTGRLDRYPDLWCPLLGDHQRINAAVAVGLAECLYETGLPLDTEAIHAGIGSVVWPGRLQVLHDHPLLLLDGAHDPASIDALLAALDRHFPGRPRRFVVGFSREKDWRHMLRQLAPAAVELVLTAAENPRAVPPEELAAEASPLETPLAVIPHPANALATALAQAAPDDLICVTGSLFLIGDALKWWRTAHDR